MTRLDVDYPLISNMNELKPIKIALNHVVDVRNKQKTKQTKRKKNCSNKFLLIRRSNTE